MSRVGRAIVFLLVAARPKIGVIPILLAAARIHAGRLEVSIGVLAEPGFLISGRQGNRVETIDRLAIGDAFPVLVEILPVPALLLACVPRLAVAGVPQPAAIALLFVHRGA